MKGIKLFLMLIGLLVVVVACGENSSDGESANVSGDLSEVAAQKAEFFDTEVVEGEVTISTVVPHFVSLAPVELRIDIAGTLSDSCMDNVISGEAVDSRTYNVTITAESDEGIVCNNVATPFALSTPLVAQAFGLSIFEAGTYTVRVNGQVVTFDITEAILAGEAPEGFVGSEIEGTVWNDICGMPTQPPYPLDLPAGCVKGSDMNGVPRVMSDGLLSDSEAGFAGITVVLGEGACGAAASKATTTTAADGTYVFSGLTAGTYCVSVDSAANAVVFGNGVWTFPYSYTGQHTISLQSGDSASDVDFGWYVIN